MPSNVRRMYGIIKQCQTSLTCLPGPSCCSSSSQSRTGSRRIRILATVHNGTSGEKSVKILWLDCVLGIITLCKLLWWLWILWLNNPALIAATRHNAMNTMVDWFICKKEGGWDDVHSGVKVQLFKVMSLQRENGSVVASAAHRNQPTCIALNRKFACNDQIDRLIVHCILLNPYSFQFSVSLKLKSKMNNCIYKKMNVHRLDIFNKYDLYYIPNALNESTIIDNEHWTWSVTSIEFDVTLFEV